MATINAASTTLADVQTAVDSASSGDTVVVPSGSRTWAGALDIYEDIILQGAGIGQTVITRAGEVGYTHACNPRITGFTFTGNGMYWSLEDPQSLRIDHCRLVNTSGDIQTLLDFMSQQNPNVTHPRGLVDHCEVVNGRLLIRGTAYMRVEGSQQDQLWYEDFAYGSAGYVFFEDNEFWATFNCSCVDSDYGGRYVFRHNTIHCAYLEFHSVQGDNRAGRRWEIYSNTFVVDDAENFPDGVWVPMFIRGGTGVCFDNVFDSYNNPPVFNNVRDTEDREDCGQCDGTSDWDQNTSGQAGYACRDQIGRGRDTTQWTTGAAYTQVLEPAYWWDNVDGSDAAVSPEIHNPSTPNHIVENRDYYLSEKSGYTPYTYPHPLQGSEETQTMYVSCWA